MKYYVWKATTKSEWSIVEANVKNNKGYNNQKISVYPYNIKDNGVQKYIYGGLASSEEELAEFKNLIHDCEFELITNTARDYNEAEALLSEKVEKHDKYILVRSEYGSIESFQTSYAHLIRKYGNATIAKDSKNDMLSKFIENKTFIGSEEDRTQNCSVIPTLLKLDKSTVKSYNNNLTFPLERIYDDNVVLKYLKKGAIFNVYLPYIGDDKSDTNTTYTFYDNSDNDISFVLPNQMFTRMLYLQLDEMQQGCIENTNSIISVVFNKDASESKGYATFNNMTIDDFNQLQITDESDESIKTIYLYDGQMDYTFKFSCYTKNLPIPALSDGLFAYVDGSSLKTGKEKEVYGTGVVLSENNTVRFCHSEGVAKGSNFIGEIQAVTELLKELNNMPDADTTVRIFFDNTAVGYYPHGLFGWNEHKDDNEHKYVIAYKEALDKFVEKHPNVRLSFEHLDAHCKIFGNEFADRIAKVENTEVEDEEVAPGYFEKRNKACTTEGGFSNSFKIKTDYTNDETDIVFPLEGIIVQKSLRRNKMSKAYSVNRKMFMCLDVAVNTESTWYKNVYNIAKEIEHKLNPGQANSSEKRSDEIIKIDNLAGVIAEYCCYDILKYELKDVITVEKPVSNSSYNQIDISLNNSKKTIEVRSSFAQNGVDFALFAKDKEKTDEQYFDVIGPYSNGYKPGEILKDYYMRVIYSFEKKKFIEKIKNNDLHLFITGGVTCEMMTNPSVSQQKHLKPEGGEVKIESDYFVVPLGKSLDYDDFIETMKRTL